MPAPIVVYTVIFGDYDVLRAVRSPSEAVEYVCITDRPQPLATGWDVRLVDPPPVRPYTQREYKILSHRVFPKADITIYQDGNLQLTTDLHVLVSKYLGKSDIALFGHPERNGVYDEIAACARLKKDDPHLLSLLEERYRALGMPDSGYLFSGGFILRRHTREIIEFNEAWVEELRISSPRDQMSLAYTIWSTGIEPAKLEGDVRNNDLIAHFPHKRHYIPKGRDFLFVCGNPRSGTGAMCDLLNEDTRIVVGKERYRDIRDRVAPSDFTKERFLSPTPKETNYLPQRLIPQEAHGFWVWPEDEDQVAAKLDSPELRYLGDKAPFYVRQLTYMREIFPGARFVIMIREPMGVATSYQRRASNPEDHWPATNDHTVAVAHLNTTIDNITSHLRQFGLQDVFIVQYEEFFSGDEAYLRSLYQFLGLDLPDHVLARFREITRDWNRRRRESDLSEPEKSHVQQEADWHGYALIRQTIPVMRNYRLVVGDARSSVVATTNSALRGAYRELFNLARRLDRESLRAQDGLWERFWSRPVRAASSLSPSPVTPSQDQSRVDGETVEIDGSYALLEKRLADTVDALERLRARKSVRLALTVSRAARPLIAWSRRRHSGNPTNKVAD